jgi:hypothetical protein
MTAKSHLNCVAADPSEDVRILGREGTQQLCKGTPLFDPHERQTASYRRRPEYA